MMDVLGHIITIEPRLLARNWPKYKSEYRAVETRLPVYKEVTAPFCHRLHLLGGFHVPTAASQSPLYRLFANPTKCFLLPHGGRLFSRGLAYYPGLHTDKTEAQKIDFILATSCEILDVYSAMPHACASKAGAFLYEAIALDYLRNYLLILYYALRTIAFGEYFLAGAPGRLETINERFKRAITAVDVALLKYLLSKGRVRPSLPVPELRELLNEFPKVLAVTKPEKAGQSAKLIRETREVDCLAHIYAFAHALAQKHFLPESCLVGVEYGGIELPFATNAARMLLEKEPLPIITARISNYSQHTFQRPDIQDLLLFAADKRNLERSKICWLLDDSITTGRSMQKIVRMLPRTVQRAHIAAVTFRVSNRYHQLVMRDHGGFNPLLARRSLLVCRSNYATTYRHNSYVSRSGVFNVTKHELYKILGRVTDEVSHL